MDSGKYKGPRGFKRSFISQLTEWVKSVLTAVSFLVKGFYDADESSNSFISDWYVQYEVLTCMLLFVLILLLVQ